MKYVSIFIVTLVVVFAILGTGTIQAQWIVDDFENAALGTNGWGKTWGPDGESMEVSRAEGVPDAGDNVLEIFFEPTKADLGVSKQNIPVIGVNPVTLEPDTAETFTIDVYLSDDFPTANNPVYIFTQDCVNWTWLDKGYDLSTLTLGQWNTLEYNISDPIKNNPGYKISNGIKVGIKLVLSDPGYSDVFYLDNITLTGILDPANTGIENKATLPIDTKLYSNYPNPFNPATTIKYQLASPANVTLTVYNLLGEEIRTLVNEYQVSGNYTVQWNGKDFNGLNVPSGIYLYKVQMNGKNVNFTDVKRMLLVK